MCDRSVLGFCTWTYCPIASVVAVAVCFAVAVAVVLAVDQTAAVDDHAKWVQTQQQHWYHSTRFRNAAVAAVDADMVASVVVLAALACPPSMQ